MADIAKLITQLDEALRDENTASDLRRVARILIGDPVVQTTVAPPYASTSRVERIAEDLADMRRELTLAIANGHEETQRVERIAEDLTDLNARIEHENQNIWSYIQHVKTDLSERFTAADRARTDRIAEDVAELRDRITSLTVRIVTLEQLVDQLEAAPTPNIPANDPEPQVDTSWHSYDVLVDGVIHDHPTGGKRVVVMTRSGLIDGPFTAQHAHWDERGVMTIVAWRYAKEEE